MRHPLRAVMLSALVFPGAGQAALGLRRRALCFALPALLAALAFAWQLRAPVQALAEALAAGRMAPDPLAILAQLQAAAPPGSLALNLAAAVMLACWIGSIADAWLRTR